MVFSIMKKEKGSIDSVTKLFPKPQRLPMANENGSKNGLLSSVSKW
jgi:hypothetical protein